MNKLFLIGNGFDLAHGLKTRYSDFILWYLNKIINKTKTDYYYEDGLIKVQTQLSLNHVDEIKSVEDFNQIVLQFHGVTIDYLHPFIKSLIVHPQEYNWVDIEAEYYSYLTGLYKQLEPLNFSKSTSYYKDLKKLNQCFDLIKKELIDYLHGIESIPKEINKEIEMHFRGEIEKMVIKNGLSRTSLPNEIMVLNFNYTSTIETYFETQQQKAKHEINYIHGKLKGIEKNPIIFGYGDEIDSYYGKIEQLNDNEFLKHIKSFMYLKVNNYRKLTSFVNSFPYEVFIMGHSCGLSDRILLNSIFENPNCKSIKIFYYQRKENENDFFEKTQDMSRHFSAKGKEKMRTVIIPEEDCVPLTRFEK